MKECAIEHIFTTMVKQRGGLCLKFVSPARVGVPDRIVLAPNGRVVFVELKADGGKLSRIQERQIERMRDHGAEVRVLRGMSEAMKFVSEVFPD